jgi:hypothetical protein
MTTYLGLTLSTQSPIALVVELEGESLSIHEALKLSVKCLESDFLLSCLAPEPTSRIGLPKFRYFVDLCFRAWRRPAVRADVETQVPWQRDVVFVVRASLRHQIRVPMPIRSRGPQSSMSGWSLTLLAKSNSLSRKNLSTTA